MPDLGKPEILILLIVILVLFGAKRLPGAARSLGQSMRIFKAETKGLRSDDEAALPPSAVPPAAVPPAAAQPAAAVPPAVPPAAAPGSTPVPPAAPDQQSVPDSGPLHP